MAKILQDLTGEYYGGDVRLKSSEQLKNGGCIVNYFKNISKLNWSNNAIIAMLCNMSAESTVNPQRNQVNGSGYGLTQWTPKSKLQKRAKLLGYSANYNTMYAQCCVIDAERQNKGGQFGQWQIRNNNYNLSFEEFATSNAPVRYLVGCFLCSYEGASDRSESAIDSRYEHGGAGGVGHSDWETIINGGSGSIDGFLNWLEMIANDNAYIYEFGANHGVPWNNYLTVKKFDCSSYVSFGLKVGGGYVLETQFSTSQQATELKELGFDIIPYKNTKQLKRGDVMLKQGHTEVIYQIEPSIKLIGAHQHYPNDSARDISIVDFYDGWDYICRPYAKDSDYKPYNRKRDIKPMTFLNPFIQKRW